MAKWIELFFSTIYNKEKKFRITKLKIQKQSKNDQSKAGSDLVSIKHEEF